MHGGGEDKWVCGCSNSSLHVYKDECGCWQEVDGVEGDRRGGFDGDMKLMDGWMGEKR